MQTTLVPPCSSTYDTDFPRDSASNQPVFSLFSSNALISRAPPSPQVCSRPTHKLFTLQSANEHILGSPEPTAGTFRTLQSGKRLADNYPTSNNEAPTTVLPYSTYHMHSPRLICYVLGYRGKSVDSAISLGGNRD